MDTATKKQVMDFAATHNLELEIFTSSSEWWYSTEKNETYDDNDDHEVFTGTIDIEHYPTAGQRWYLILQDMKDLIQ